MIESFRAMPVYQTIKKALVTSTRAEYTKYLSSYIQTILSASELHRIMPYGSWAITTGREPPPALKILYNCKSSLINLLFFVKPKRYT